jgi:hypothetical protein
MNPKALLIKIAQRIAGKNGPGYIDYFDVDRVAGWAFDPDDRNEPALLSLYIDGRPEMNIVADIPREDVFSAGLGPLKCGFDTTLPRHLRDGKPHQVELRLGANGPVLRDGQLSIKGTNGPVLGNGPLSIKGTGDPLSRKGQSGTQGTGETAQQLHNNSNPSEPDQSTAEGVAFYEASGQIIAGWAFGCTTVRVVFDGHPPQEVDLRHEVPGFGSGLRPGFRIPVPGDLKDGAPHEAQIFFKGSETQLDGSPVAFSLTAGKPFVEVVSLEGSCLILRLGDQSGRAVQHDIILLADGVECEIKHSRDTFNTTLPPQTQAVAVCDLDGTVLARMTISGSQIQTALVSELPPEALNTQTCAQASAAFDAFCGDPDARFDPLWYRWSHQGASSLTEADTLIHHYQTVGARDGIGPNPAFDEATARLIYPELAHAITQGQLPCAFALALVLGPELFAGATHSDLTVEKLLQEGETLRAADVMETAPIALPPSNVKVSLPMPSHALKPVDSIYSAWLSRLEMPAHIQEEVAQDEAVVRNRIAASTLRRAPLVSIIMPSWNRAFTIGEAIQSVLEQSYENWELIICDDASDDRTSEVVRGFNDPRIRYMKFLKSNGAGARNKGLARARGEYIAYLDSDNIWHPLFLDMMLRRLMANTGYSIAYSAFLDTEITGAQVHLHGIARSPFRPVPLSSKNFIDLNSIVHHRRVYDWMGGFDNDLPRLQDWDLSLRYTSIFPPIFVNHIGVFYRRNVAWGQVTHLFMGSGIQNTVNEKTRKRLEEGHERLNLNWPNRGRITVICCDPEAAQACLCEPVVAENLAQLAVPFADVDLIVLADAPEGHQESMDGISRHYIAQELRQDPARLGTALGGILRGRPVLSIGCPADYLRAVTALDPRLVYRVRGSGEGTILQCLDTPMLRFNIGAIPLAIPDGPHAPADMTALVIMPANANRATRAKLREQLRVEAHKRNLKLLIAPSGGTKCWRSVDKTGEKDLSVSTGCVLPGMLGQVAMTISLTPVSELDPFALALMNTLQGLGVPAVVLPDEGRARATGFASQWITAKAAYGIKVNDPKWILDKVRKLFEDTNNMQRLSERSQTVHRIAFHSELAQERLAHALYRLLHDIPQQEVNNDTV